MDLLDFWRGTLTLRRLAVLIEHVALQPGSAVAVSIHGDAGRWDHRDAILAAIADAVLASAGAKDGYPRPADKAREDRMRALIEDFRRRHNKPEGGQS